MLGFLDLKTGATLVVLLAVRTQVRYNVRSFFLILTLSTMQENSKQMLHFAYIFLANHVLNTIWTALIVSPLVVSPLPTLTCPRSPPTPYAYDAYHVHACPRHTHTHVHTHIHVRVHVHIHSHVDCHVDCHIHVLANANPHPPSFNTHAPAEGL